MATDDPRPGGPPGLPDTPPWSPARKVAAACLFLAGMGNVAAGVLLHLSEAVATLLVTGGQEMMITAPGLYIGGAALERAAGWMALGRGEGRGEGRSDSRREGPGEGRRGGWGGRGEAGPRPGGGP